jgi:hypothetical protein
MTHEMVQSSSGDSTHCLHCQKHISGCSQPLSRVNELAYKNQVSAAPVFEINSLDHMPPLRWLPQLENSRIQDHS